MKELRPDLSRIALVSIALFLLLFTGLLVAFGAPWESIFQSVLKSGAVLSIIGFYWAYFERKGWRYAPLRLYGWLTDTPVLHGRWEGTICRDGENQIEHRFVLEISQTFSLLKFRTFGEKSGGESLSVSIITKDDLHTMWEVNSVWRTEARKLDNDKEYEHFTGASTWKVSANPGSGTYSIVDRYFTSRRTSGTMRVKFASPHLIGRFQ